MGRTPIAGAPIATPVPLARRIALVDALRGLALFGIIQINLPGFLVGADPLYALLGPDARTADRWVFTLNTLLVEGKFYPLFAFLFGYGFALQWRSIERAGFSPKALLVRRYGFLLVLGILHGTLLFFGDILTMYAVTGFLLLQTTPRKVTGLRQTIWAWLALSILLVFLGAVSPPGFDTQAGGEAMFERVGASIAELAHGPFLTAALGRVDVYCTAQLYQLTLLVPQLMVFMSLGVAAARAGLLRRPDRHLRTWRLCAVIGLVLGLPINVALVLCQLKLADPESATPAIAIVSQVLYPFACLLTPLYVVLVVWLNRTAKRAAIGGWILWVLACMGRVALTNYLLQSVGMLLLLSSLGLGLADRLSLEDLALIGFATCLTQAGSAVLLLRWFRMGPAEWIWRRYVYAGAAVPLQPKN